jgi:glycine hydroxymethyltransferase
MSDFLFRGNLAKLDRDVFDLTQLEAERQARKLILIPSESTAPMAVREALASAFQNIYAEGYPDEESRWMTEEEILDYPARLAHYRRNGDPRYYKGVEYADAVEALARRRAVETFAANGFTADQIFVNVQALSGAPANNAVYQALIGLGETVMGLNLLHGGHLSHGSSVNRSGKWFKAVHYTVDAKERLDYDAIRTLALEAKPKLIIAFVGSRLEEIPRNCRRGRRILPGGHLAHWRIGRGGRGAFADWHRACDDVYHAQESRRPARRSLADHRRGDCQEDRQGRLPR